LLSIQFGRLTAGSSGARTGRRPAGRRPARRRISSGRCRSSTSGPCRSSPPRPRPRASTGRAARATAPPPPTSPLCPCRTSRPRRTPSVASPPAPARRSLLPRSAGDDVAPWVLELWCSRLARNRNLLGCSMYLHLGLKTDGTIPVFVGFYFRIYENRNVSVFTKVEMRFLRPFSKNPVFTWN